jgi:hypothetical protein
MVAMVAMVAAFPAGANAEIVYTHGQTSPPSSGTFVPSALWAMNDDGSDPHQLVTAAQAPSSQQAVCCGSLQPNSSTAVFQGFDYQYSGNAAGGYGAYYEGMYVLSGGTVVRLSPQPAAAPGQTSLDAPAVLTANGQVIFQHTGVTYEPGNPGQIAGTTQSMDEGPLSGGAANPWTWVGDSGPSSFPPATYASDPADPSLIAYTYFDSAISPATQLYIANQAGTAPVTVATQPSPYGNAGLAWSPDGTELIDVDGTSASNVGTPGADGFSPGIWEFSASALGAHHLVIASNASSGQFTSPVFVGQNEIAFAAENNIWEVPASCNACTFPSGAKQLTTDGTSSVPDFQPSWTAQPITPVGGSGGGSGGGGSGGGGSGGASSSTLGKVRHSGTTVSITIKCSSGTGSCHDTIGLAARETLRGSKVTAVAASKTKHKLAVLGSKAVTVAAGRSQTVSVSLNGAGKSLQKKFHRLPLLLVVLQGKTTVGSDKVTLVAPKHKH